MTKCTSRSYGLDVQVYVMSNKKNSLQNRTSTDFRLRTKKFFLTYPQLPDLLDLEEIALSTFEIVFRTSRRDFKYLISTERHIDGNPHLHVFLEFGLPQGIYSSTKLDLVLDGKIYHGNYQSVKSSHSTKQYIIKSVDIEKLNTNMTLPLYNNRYFTDINEHLYEVLVNEGEQAAVDVLYSMYPKESIQRGSTLLGNLGLASVYNSTKNESNKVPKYTLKDFAKVPTELLDWLKEKHPLTLLLFGPSATGKTELGKALLYERGARTVFIRNKHALKLFRPGFHQAILFDDLNPDDFVYEEIVHLIDQENESQIKIVYAFVKIPAHTLTIITTNRPEAYLKYGKAVERRLKLVSIPEPLFSLSPNPSLTSDNPSLTSDIPARTVAVKEFTDDSLIIHEAEIVKKKGRPKGSKNKYKK